MKMFNALLICLFVFNLSILECHGQHSIKGATTASKTATPLDDRLLEEFKTRTTIFIAREDDDAELLEEELRKVWTVNELKVIHYGDLDVDLDDQDYAFFEIQGKYTASQKAGSNMTVTCSYIYLKLHFTTPNEEGEDVRESVASTVLHPDIETMLRMASYSNEDSNNEFSYHIYNDADLYNWNELTIINFVKLVNDHLEAREGRDKELTVYDDERLSVLAKETLYMPAYILRKYSPLKYSEDTFQDEEDLFARYKYDYEVVSAEDLVEIYLEAEAPFYYLTAVKDCNKIFVNVVNGLTGEIIYSDMRLGAYNMKSRDIRFLNSNID